MSEDKFDKTSYVESIFYKLSETARVSELMARNFYKDFTERGEYILDLDEFKILSHISQDPKLSQSDISKLMYKGKAHIGKILNAMEEKNYITRVLSSKNNIMVKQTVLTDYGKKLYDYTDRSFKKLGERILENFSSEELESLALLLDKMKQMMLENNKIYF